jgi:hypothetical protein
MAVASTTTGVAAAGTPNYDSGLTNTAVLNVADGTSHIRTIWVDSSALNAAVFQMFDAKVVSLGTTAPNFAVKCPASAMFLISILGDDGVEFSTALSYAMTDAVKGSTITGAARKLYLVRD